ncbi:hypothetical protein ZIOFF_011218 [Zingiber officinale]|uniref:Cyclin-dependent kinase inhibitor domain-containing protein n=1 Tax=Zingiber officinale TaxID=94328 RepID=A0A8J5I5F9_ZINOF|nr:hypothetical protein ZIOFF_011218 [Zingiber officinale]
MSTRFAESTVAEAVQWRPLDGHRTVSKAGSVRIVAGEESWDIRGSVVRRGSQSGTQRVPLVSKSQRPDPPNGAVSGRKARRAAKREEGQGMGKYMTKCGKGAGELSVMEVTQVAGVTTRARALAIASAADAAAATAVPKRRKAEVAPAPSELVQTSSYIQLRSRRLVMTGDLPPPRNSLNSAFSWATTEKVASRSSSNASSDVMVEEPVMPDELGRCLLVSSFSPFRSLFAFNFASFSSRCLNFRREARHSSAARLEGGDLESTARTTTTSTSTTPTKSEIEEFFDAAERDQALRFADKYNYDVINDVPLNGRFRWVPIDL